MKLELVPCICMVRLARGQRADLGVWDLSSAPAAQARLPKRPKWPSHFHLQSENGEKRGLSQLGFASVQNQVV